MLFRKNNDEVENLKAKCHCYLENEVFNNRGDALFTFAYVLRALVQHQPKEEIKNMLDFDKLLKVLRYYNRFGLELSPHLILSKYL